jgi:outer membrane protein assembly factor BamB
VRVLASYGHGTLELHLDGRRAGRLRLNLLTWVSWELFGARPAGRVAAGLIFVAWAGFLVLLALAWRRFAATRSRLAALAAAGAAAVVLALAGAAAAAEPAGSTSWPCWRGPAGDGISGERGLPERFGRSEGVVWSREDPGLGHSSPIVWEDSLFFTTCAGDSRLLVRLRAGDGGEVWRREVLKSPPERRHQKNSAASATPATDGERVYTAFLADGRRVACVAYDFAGKEAWRVSPGEFHSMHGFSSTPVLYADLVILNCDQDADAYLVAFDRRTGDTRWRADRAEKIRSYCPPSFFTVEGRPQMVLSGAKKISAYEPATGKPIWWCDGPTEQTVATLAHGSGLVFVTGGYPDREILAIDPRGRGDVTASHVRWRAKQGVSYVPSPVYRDGHFYVVSDTGVLSAIAAGTGNYAKQKRLRGNFSASLLIAGERLYAFSEEGDVFVLRASPELETLAEIAMEEPIYATPAVAGGRMYLRTWKRIYAIGKGPAPASAAGGS